MAKAELLQRVIDDISHKDLWNAKQRLFSHHKENPTDLRIRHILGNVCLLMQHPIEAGRFLYLVENPSDEAQKAIIRFEETCDNDPVKILLHLKIRFKIDELEEGFAKDRAQALHEEYKKREREGKVPSQSKKHVNPSWWVSSSLIGCLAFLAVALITGVIHVGIWVWRLISGWFS